MNRDDHHAAIDRAIDRAGGPEWVRFVPIAPEVLLDFPMRFSGTIHTRDDDGLVDLVFERDRPSPSTEEA
jgi:hypothetical protein